MQGFTGSKTLTLGSSGSWRPLDEAFVIIHAAAAELRACDYVRVL